MLGLSAVGSGFLGAHMTASIGGADMPVVRRTKILMNSAFCLASISYMLSQQYICLVGGYRGFVNPRRVRMMPTIVRAWKQHSADTAGILK